MEEEYGYRKVNDSLIIPVDAYICMPWLPSHFHSNLLTGEGWVVFSSKQLVQVLKFANRPQTALMLNTIHLTDKIIKDLIDGQKEKE